MKCKGADRVGDYYHALSLLATVGVSALFSVLSPNSTCLLIMSTFLRFLYKVNYYPGTVTMETSTFHLYRVTKSIFDTCDASSSHFMAYHQPPVRGIRR